MKLFNEKEFIIFYDIPISFNYNPYIIKYYFNFLHDYFIYTVMSKVSKSVNTP